MIALNQSLFSSFLLKFCLKINAILGKIMNEHELLTNNDYKIDIGIEVHVQLNTKSKIFCYCQNGPAELANINICQICTGQP